MGMKDCNCCGKEVDFEQGGAALMIAFCVNHSTTLTNVAFCGECYKALVEENLKKLDGSATLMLNFGEETDDDTI